MTNDRSGYFSLDGMFAVARRLTISAGRWNIRANSRCASVSNGDAGTAGGGGGGSGGGNNCRIGAESVLVGTEDIASRAP